MKKRTHVPKFLGRHFLAEYYDCRSDRINDADYIEKILLETAERIGATVIGHVFHRFSPQGVSGVVVIAESHISIHTWPEYHYAAVDIFSCSASIDPEKACEILKVKLFSGRSEVREIKRGSTVDVLTTAVGELSGSD